MSAYTDYLKSASALLSREILSLKADGRQDEANLSRIRQNIYDVCLTVHAAFAQRFDESHARAVYDAKLLKFDTHWHTAMEQALLHGDAEKAEIEKQKLAALADIRSHFAELE